MTRLSDLVRTQAATFMQDEVLSYSVRAVQGETAQDWSAVAKQELQNIASAIRAQQPAQFQRCPALARQLVSLLQQSDEPVRWVFDDYPEDQLLDHAIHVAVLAVKVGIGLQYSEEALERLALAGLLHDVGMWTLPTPVIEKQGALTDGERDLIRTHPERGYRVLASQGTTYEWLSTISVQAHERWDGSGYPGQLRGAQIDESAQIIGLVDALDAMTAPRSYHRALTPHHALRELFLHARTGFSQRVLKALGDQITFYPIGTSIRLTSGEIGTVVRVNVRYPLQPVVMIKQYNQSREVDLSQMMSGGIAEVVQPRVAS